MAIAFARIHYVSRAKGHSAVAAIAYRSGTKLHDERRGKVENYLNHSDHVIHSEIMLPDGADETYKDREVLWNAVEAAEDQFNKHRKRAQVAVDCILALPKDDVLTKHDLIELTRRFAQEYFVSKGIPVDFNIHDKGDGNPHAHILRTTRRLDSHGFDPLKARDLNPEVRSGRVQVDELEWEKWRNFQNHYFEEKGLDLRVDPNGIISQVHLGKHTFHHPHREKTNHWQDNEARKEEALSISLNSPAALLNQITLNRAIFTRADLAKLINRQLTKQGITDSRVFQNTLAKVEASSQLMMLGPGSDGKEYFTTRAMFDTENDIQDFADYLKNQHRHRVSDRVMEQNISHSTLSKEQADAVRHIVSAKGISALLGRAGTGKSYTLGIARDIWTQAGLRVSGIALSGKAADNLEKSSGIPSRTIESFRYGLASGRIKLTRHDVVVMDEAGMADSTQFRDVLHAVAKARAKFVYAGDPDQTLPVGPGAPLRALLERTGYAELSEIRRQKVAWMREATRAFAEGNIEKALGFYQRRAVMTVAPIVPKDSDLKMGHIVFYKEGEHFFSAFRTEARVVREKIFDPKAITKIVGVAVTDGPVAIDASSRLLRACRYHEHMNKSASFIHFEQNADSAMTRLIEDWQVAYSTKGASACAIMAYTNAEVAALNTQAREALIRQQSIRNGVRVALSSGEKRLAIGERVQFLKNDRRFDVVNGQFATIKTLARDKKGRVLGIEVLVDGQTDTFMIDLSEYNSLDYGYAATVNKFQGQTVDDSFTYVSGYGWNRTLAYTAMGRHRESARLYVNQDNFADMTALTRAFSREAPKDSFYDWPWHFRERRGIPVNDTVVSRFRAHLAKKLNAQLSRLRDEVKAQLRPQEYWSRKARDAQAQSNTNAQKRRHHDAVIVFDYVEAAKSAGQVWAHVFDTYNKNQARFGESYQLSDHTQYQEAMTLAAKRDAIAFNIAEDVSRYEAACQHYQLDLDKLKKQARSHLGRETVKRYLDAIKAGESSLRHELAYQIIQDGQSHAAGIGYYQEPLNDALHLTASEPQAIWKQLRDEAHVHERKLMLSELTDQEKIRFETVETYIKAYHQTAALWQQYFEQIKKKNIDTRLLEAAETASRLRNKQAGIIYNSLDDYRVGLNFYHIDKPDSIDNLYGRASTNEEARTHRYYSAQRAVKLQKYAYQDYAKKRFDDYVASNDTREKSILADSILRYPKQHNRWISEAAKQYVTSAFGDLSQEEKEKQQKARFFEVKRALFDDAILVRREKLIENFSESQLADLLCVEQFILDDKAVRDAWKHFYDNGKHEKDALIANRLSEKRDHSAIAILNDIPRFSSGLALYAIKLDTLEKSLQAQACRDRVTQFLNPHTPINEKQSIAAFMVEHRGAHTAALSLSGIDWRTIYPYADTYNRRDLKATLDASRLDEFNVLSRYVRLKRRLARVIARKIEKRIKWKPEQQRHFNRLQAERNALASQLLQLPYRDSELWAAFRLTPTRCEKHALKHAVIVSQLHTYRDERAQLKTQLRTLLKKSDSLEDVAATQDADFLQHQARYQALSQLAHHFIQQGEKIIPALEQVQLSQSDLIADRDFINTLKRALSVKYDDDTLTHVTHTTNATIELPKPIVLSKGKKRWDLHMIKDRLNERASDVAKAAVHPSETFNAKKSNANNLIWGEKGGSLQVTIQGDKVGYWNDFSSTQGGGRDLLSFIQTQQSVSFAEAIDWAVQFLGLGEQDMSLVTPTKVLTVEQQQHFASETFTDQQWKRILEARTIWAESLPIKDTLAERYLREHRQIDDMLSPQFRFHPRVMNYDNRKYYPALVVSATNDKGEVQAIQAIYLDSTTANKIDKRFRQKQNLGPTKGACVWLNGYEPGQPIAVVEGPETAATLLQAKGKNWAVVCTLGSSNFKSLSLPKEAKHLILVQDNDGDNAKPEKSALDAADFYAKRGVTTWRVKPKQTSDDFNDLHQKAGIDAVRDALKRGQLCQKGLDPDAELKALQKQIFDHSLAPTTQEDWLAQARVLNRTGQTEMTLDILHQQGMIISGEHVADTQARCLKDYLHTRQGPSLNYGMIAFTAAEVNALNQGARYLLKHNQKITNTRHIKMGDSFKEFGVGDVIRFTDSYTVKDITKHQRAKIIALNSGKISVAFADRRQVTFKLSDFNHFDYGYALLPEQSPEKLLKQAFAYISAPLQQKVTQSLLEQAHTMKMYYAKKRFTDTIQFKSAICERPKPDVEPTPQVTTLTKNKKRRYDDLPKPEDDFFYE